jgi:succinate dehydrogenase/fumarate reductase flavoprotein subunit
MAQSLTHDVLILGAGLAGLRAAVELSHRTEGHIDIGIVSVQLMRAHSVCAEAARPPSCARTGRQHRLRWTGEVSDFLADQDVVDRFVHAMPNEIRLLDHWGIPWTRDEHGRIEQRPFGGHSYPRATLAADKTGFFEMQTLYDTLLRYKGFTRYDEFFVTDILSEDGRFRASWASMRPAGDRGAATARHCSSTSWGGRSTASRPTRRPSRATAWRWRTAPVCRSRTWSSFSSTPPVWCLPGS